MERGVAFGWVKNKKYWKNGRKKRRTWMRITYFKMGGLFGSRVGNEDELQIHIFLPDIYPKEEEVQLVSREDMSFGINFCKIKKNDPYVHYFK